MNILPVPLEALAASHGGLNEFRVVVPAEITRLLRTLADDSVLLNFNGPNGSAVAARLSTIDVAAGVLGFSADADDPQLQPLLEGDEAVVVGWLDSIKLQFDVHDLVLVHNGSRSALRCSVPREMWRFQRRNAFRVRPLLRAAPTATFRHPALADMRLVLRVLDMSIGGCALFLPDDVPPIAPGVQVNGVQLRLDEDTDLVVSLRLQHVTGINPESHGVRLGCEMVRPGSDVERTLQRYIDQTQKRRRLMALD